MLRQRGIEVHCICPRGEYVERLLAIGAIHIPIEVSRFVNPFSDMKYMGRLLGIFCREKYDYVHCFTIKPNIFGTLAAAIAGIPRRMMTFEGLGAYGSAVGGWRRRPMHAIINGLYRISCALTHKAWFLNPDDLRLFRTRRIITERKTVLVPSAGVNMNDYSRQAISEEAVSGLRRELGLSADSQVVSLILARFIWTKGIAEFAYAARQLSTQFPNAVFVLVGRVESESPDSTPEEFLLRLRSSYFRVLDFLQDVRPLIALSDVVVLPSYYGEGVPRILLEAMAMGKPIVTTDSVGCRETVEQGRNGFLVRPRDSNNLALAIAKLLSDPALARAFGAYGKQKVQREFTDEKVHCLVLEKLYGLKHSCQAESNER